MKLNAKMLALMAALAAGVASAEPAAPTANTSTTKAGETITNVASASFTDPANPTDANGNPTTPLTSTSNTVETKVLPLPAFDITYADGTLDGSTNAPANSASASTPANFYTADATPNQVITETYALVNNGNTPIVVHITPAVTGLDASDVTYAFPAGTTYTKNADGSYDVTLPQGAIINFDQTITVPDDAAVGTVVGASPVGVAYATANTANGVPSDMQENQTVTVAADGTKSVTGPTAGTDLQYTAATVYTPVLNNNPNTTPTSPVDPSGNSTTPVPPLTTVNVPTIDPGTPDDNTPTEPVDGYITTPTTPITNTPGGGTDPSYDPAIPGSGTPIVPNVTGDVQIAYPKADDDNGLNGNTTAGTNDTVVFTNTLTNSGNADDKAQLFPVNPTTGLPDTTFTWNPADSTFTNADGVVVRFIDPTTGAPIKVDTADGATYPTVVIPEGSTAVYYTEVTYPDKDDSKPISPITIVIGADSLSDADTGGIKSETNTTDTIMPPAAQFGDSTPGTQGAVPTPPPVQVVDPSAATGNPLTSPNTTDSTASFPMDVANNGQYEDSYTLSGTVDFGNGPVAVKYYGDDGKELPKDGNGNYITPTVAPGAEIVVYAVVDVPAGTTAGDYTVSQKAVGNYSTIEMVDTNDIIRVAPVGSVVVGKFTQTPAGTPNANTQAVTDAAGNIVGNPPTATQVGNPAGYDGINQTSYLPGVPYSYKIIGKNNYNTTISNFVLTDPLNTALTLNSINCNGGQASQPVVNGKVTATCTYATLAAGATATMEVNVTIK